MQTGKVFQLPNGTSIWIDTITLNQIPRIGKLISKQEYDKKMKTFEVKYLVWAWVDDNIAKHKVEIFYIRRDKPCVIN